MQMTFEEFEAHLRKAHNKYFDSLDWVETVMLFENSFDIEISDRELQDQQSDLSVEGMLAFFRSKMK